MLGDKLRVLVRDMANDQLNTIFRITVTASRTTVEEVLSQVQNDLVLT